MAWTETAAAPQQGDEVLARLTSICATRGLDGLADRLSGLATLVGGDMAEFEAALGALGAGDDLVRRSAAHLLDRTGKRLRPMCVALSARVGSGFDVRARPLAVAVELVHAATLLHDDVIDLGEVRRGAPAARTIYGNAASIFADDWLLVEALRRVRRADVPGTLDESLEVIDQMIRAEALQLERRGRVDSTRDGWLAVVEGKTAALFQWAMHAGGRAGGLDEDACTALSTYGLHLGVAFQAVDDVLDLTGDASLTGKALFADLREGKMTWPLIVAVERNPALPELLERIVELPAGVTDDALRARVLDALARTGAVRDCIALARERAARAVESLSALPAGPAVDALTTVAVAAVSRKA